MSADLESVHASSDPMNTMTARVPLPDSLWRMRLTQLGVVVRIELGLTLFTRRSLISYGLTVIPFLFLLVLGTVVRDDGQPITENIDNARRIFAYVFMTFIIGAVVFLGSAAIFTSLFRSDMLNRNVHYYLLTPIRREILAVGKYLAGLLAAWIIFLSTTVISFALLYLPYGLDQLIRDLTLGVSGDQLLTYMGITVLACIGYGSVFTVTGLVFRNPLLPVMLIAGWEVIHFALPPALKIFSVVHYLKGLMPMPISEGPFAVLSVAPTATESILGILFLTVLSLVIAIVHLRRMEVRYTDD
ncbi:MAG: hypothetical protein AAF525_03980 [Pseudomonadota bacterium]